ncbi:GrpB family protein [Streptosporangium lutulentum]|uniref:GrpB-like predicted nucleotidyltransferase (UPF0157 family) n=1 Tax=Streptosporangium lutulentum TaxID=1461250 RepID=A0ABT9QL79_9ACTN|nr:GrpB family protein [Streptosporangium lutulentum]MDP9847023.1 GrpB-like predicted nucleotidyltransferase (UPF0157 family) [Streptosporangium lutulentum]
MDAPSRDAYAEVKREPAERHRHDRLTYTQAKDAICWQIIQRADEWAQQTGWEPGPSDA